MVISLFGCFCFKSCCMKRIWHASYILTILFAFSNPLQVLNSTNEWPYWIGCWMPQVRCRESSTRCNFRKHMQIKETTSSIWQHTGCKCSQHNPKKKRDANRKKHLQIKKTLSSIWQRTRCKCSQHNQKRNALQKNVFGCVIMSTCTICCQNGENVFLICWCFFYLHAGPALGMGKPTQTSVLPTQSECR